MKQLQKSISPPHSAVSATGTVALLIKVVGSPIFFGGIVGLLVVQAAWIALTSHYPMAFDEDFHLGIIRIYAHHLNPFLNGQPAGANAYGAVARDPSYLYQYLMSFPYRLISACTKDQTIQVLVLRFINIGLFAVSLYLYRKLLATLKATPVAVNLSLLFFVLIPVVPLLAAQINYDNLFLPAVALSLLMTITFLQRLRADSLDLPLLAWLMIVCALGSLVKYAFLPVFVVIGFTVSVALIGKWRARHSDFWRLVRRSVAAHTQLRLSVLIVLVMGAIGLFSQRYVVNIVAYHAPIPDCSKVLTIKACSAYGPWIRDYNYSINKVDTARNVGVFTADWLYGMWLRLYFAVDGPARNFETRGPLPVPSISAIVIAVVGLLALLAGFSRLRRRYDATIMTLLLSSAAVYILILWLDEHKAYVRTGLPVAINGRYLLPFIPQLLILSALAGRELLDKYPRVIISLAIVIIGSQLWGGGVITYIMRSNDGWYWPNPVAHSLNRTVRQALAPVTPGYRQPTEFLR